MGRIFDALVQDSIIRRQQEAQRRQLEQGLSIFGPQTQNVPFQADTFGPEDPLAQLQSQGQSGLFDRVQTPGLLSQEEIPQIASLMQANPQFGSALMQQLMPQAQKPEYQIVNVPTGEMAPDGVTPMMQQTIVDKVSGQLRPFGSPAPRGSGTTINVGDNKMNEVISVSDLKNLRMPDGSKVPYGMTYGQAQAAGVQTYEKVTPEQAGKMQAFQDAFRDVRQLKGMLIDDSGNVNRALVLKMAGNVPFTKGRTATSLLRGAISAKVKAETGATANEEEINDMMVRFNVSTFDDDATIIDKMDRLEEFMGQSLKITNPEMYNKFIGRSKQKPISEMTDAEIQAELNALEAK